MSLGRVIRSGVRRRRVQTFVTGLATTVAVTAAVLGASLLVASEQPFDQAFNRQHGAHLVAEFDSRAATTARLVASGHAAGVTAAAGPFPTATTNPQGGAGLGLLPGAALPPMTVVGRGDPAGPVDDIALTKGRWPSGPGQIALSRDYELPSEQLGATLRFPDLPGNPVLTVVGFARSVSRTADAWVLPSEVARLDPAGAAGGYQMVYRFAAAGSATALARDRAAVAAAVPAGALRGTQSWLDVRQGSDRNTALFIPFLVAFGLLGVVMSILIVGNVVAGAVGAGTRRIGILKALGCTPAQIVRAYIGQALIPATVGTAIGAVAGSALSVPVLAATAQVYGTSSSGIAPLVTAAVIAGSLGLVALTAWAAALRAGRLRTVDALAVGRTVHTTRGRRAARLAGRLRLPRPVSLGLAQPFARPARAAAMAAAIVFGTTAATFAVGMASSLSWVQAAKNHDTADVTVDAAGPAPAPARRPPPHLDPAIVAATISAQAGTRSYYGTAVTDVTVAGVAGSTSVTAFTGNSAAAAYRMVAGRWFHGPGEGVAPATLMTATSTRLGDTVTLVDHGRTIPVRLVGEVFDPHSQTNEILTDAATLAAAEPDLHPVSYQIMTEPGTDVARYIDALNASLTPSGLSAYHGKARASDVVVALDMLTVALTLMLVAVAGLGVLNTVLLQTRERIRDIGVAKALGMTPRQTVTMVVASVALVGVLGGAIGLPLGLAMHRVTLPAMGHSAGLNFPAAAIDVYLTPELIMLGLGGPVIAVLGSLLPAGWAARVRTVTALRTE